MFTLKSWKWYLDPSVDWRVRHFVLSRKWKRIWYFEDIIVENCPLPRPIRPAEDDNNADVYLRPMIKLNRFDEDVPFLQLILKLDLSQFVKYWDKEILHHKDFIIDILREQEYAKPVLNWDMPVYIERDQSLGEWMYQRESNSGQILEFTEDSILPLGDSEIYLDMAARRFLTRAQLPTRNLCRIEFHGGCVIGETPLPNVLLSLPTAAISADELPVDYNQCHKICQNGNRCKRKIDFSKEDRYCGRHKKKQKTSIPSPSFNWPYSLATLLVTLPESVDDWGQKIQENGSSVVCLKTNGDCQRKTYDELLRARFVILSVSLIPQEDINYSQSSQKLMDNIVYPRAKFGSQTIGEIISITHWHRLIIHQFPDFKESSLHWINRHLWNKHPRKWAFTDVPVFNLKQLIRFLSNRNMSPCNQELRNYVNQNLFYWHTFVSRIRTDTIKLKMTDEERLLYAQAISQGQPAKYLRQICSLPNMNYAHQLNIISTDKFNRDIIQPKLKNILTLRQDMDVLEQNDDRLLALQQKHQKLLSESTFLESVDQRMDTEICCICLENIEKENTGLTSCGHIYCYSPCLMKLVANLRECAHCKYKLNDQNIFLVRNPKNPQENDTADNDKEFTRKYGTKMAWLLKLTDHKKTIIVIPSDPAYQAGISRIMKLENRSNLLSWPKKRRGQSNVVKQFINKPNTILLLNHRERLYRLREIKANAVVFLTPTIEAFGYWIDMAILKNLAPTVKTVTHLQTKGTVEDV